MRVLSFGGGVQTSALSVLLVERLIEPVDAIVFADTGDETPQTYGDIEILRAYLATGEYELTTVTNDDRSLERHILEDGYAAIPLFAEDGGMSPRQCTNQFKVRPIKRWARSQGATALTMLIGISINEVHRIKPDRERWVTREYPLIERRLTRMACRDIVLAAGLPDPPRSACFYCPFSSRRHWKVLASTQPEHYERAIAIEEAVNAQPGKRKAYLTAARVPLRQQHSMNDEMLDLDGFGNECEGHCGV